MDTETNREYVFKEEFLENTDYESEDAEKQNEPLQNTRSEGCFRLVFIEAVALAAIVLSALFMKTVAPKAYSRLKMGYISATTEQDITFSDIKNLFEKIGDYLFTDDKKQGEQTASDIPQNESSSISETETEGAGGEDEKALPDSVTQSAYVLTTRISAPTKGTVTSQFGWRIHPITRNEGFHTGIDIANALGTPITAAFSGSIYECGKSAAYGNYILMRHSDNLYTFYGHCNSLKATKGMNIRSGEVIAYMGSTGYSTGPHLHFEIRIGGKRVDPAYVLKGIEDIEF